MAKFKKLEKKNFQSIEWSLRIKEYYMDEDEYAPIIDSFLGRIFEDGTFIKKFPRQLK